MFFPFTNYRKIDVPQTNGNVLIHTTTADSLVFFTPRGINMESDTPVGVYVENYFTDTDGQVNRPWIFMVFDLDDGGGFHHMHPTSHHQTYSNSGHIVPAGKDIRTYVADSSDRIGGTLYVFELP